MSKEHTRLKLIVSSFDTYFDIAFFPSMYLYKHTEYVFEKFHNYSKYLVFFNVNKNNWLIKGLICMRPYGLSSIQFGMSVGVILVHSYLESHVAKTLWL